MTSSQDSVPDREPTMGDIAETVQGLADKIDRLTDELTETRKDLEQSQKWQDRTLEQTQRWQDRTWDVIKWVGGISAGLSISAAIALVGIVLRAALMGQ